MIWSICLRYFINCFGYFIFDLKYSRFSLLYRLCFELVWCCVLNLGNYICIYCYRSKCISEHWTFLGCIQFNRSNLVYWCFRRLLGKFRVKFPEFSLLLQKNFSFYYPKIVKHWIWLVWINMLSLRSSALWIYSSQILEFELKILSQLGYLLLPTLWIPFLYGSFLVSKDFHGHGSNLGSEGFSGPINGPFSPSEQNLKNIFRARSRCNLSNDRLHE